ncbi:MAG TPA: hypothetical protein VJ276_24555 [Thermoanaerobaculia bacterium]|nr:hypothetical protein [Thermoanaerobaculia bacterium]
MTFYVQKWLANGPVRFGVTPRIPLETIDTDPALSTGPAGEFLRRRMRSFYFADTTGVGSPTMPQAKSIASTPFWSSLRPDSARGWGFIGLIAIGALLLLAGASLLLQHRPQGWIEVILGLILIAIPIVLTAQQRRVIRAQEERERAEHEERDRKHREILAAYAAALEEVRRGPTEEALNRVAQERKSLDLPYRVWAPAARDTVLQIGFETLGREGVARAPEVTRLMDRVAYATGLSSDDAFDVRSQLYEVLVWHLLADDRLGEAQEEQLKELRKAFNLWDRDVPLETKAAEEFRKLRGVTKHDLPKQQCPIKLGYREYCIHSARGQVLKRRREGKVEKLVPVAACGVYITNKRVVIDGKRHSDIPLSQIDDVEVDVDNNILTIKAAGGPTYLQTDDPIFTASLIDIATTIDERPKGFS